MEESLTKERNEKKRKQDKGFFYTKRNFVRMQIQKYPYFVCGKGVGRNSVQCTKCQHWVHKRCSGVHGSLTKEKDFTCRKCIPGVLFQNEDEMINLV